MHGTIRWNVPRRLITRAKRDAARLVSSPFLHRREFDYHSLASCIGCPTLGSGSCSSETEYACIPISQVIKGVGGSRMYLSCVSHVGS